MRPEKTRSPIGVTSRAIYRDPRVWRPLMERLLSDITPGVNKIFMALNRLLADHEVLPEINAALRARSELRPANDAELLPAFKRLLANAGLTGRAGGSLSAPLADRNMLPAGTVVACLTALAKAGPAVAARTWVLVPSPTPERKEIPRRPALASPEVAARPAVLRRT